ncbi:MAG: glycosyltransferase family 2 protein [Elusimicrobiota bacterium]
MSASRSGAHGRVLLILPCWNEGAAIAKVLGEIKRLDAAYDTLVVDDGSVDDTFKTASALSPCVRLAHNLGIGGAVQTGIQYAHRHGYDFCIQIDGDGQHPPDQIAVLLAAHRAAPANILIGSRYLSRDSFQSTFARRLGSGLIAYAIRLLFGGAVVTDPTSGMRLMDRRAMAFFTQAYPHDYPEPISLAWALRHGLTLREHAVRMRGREQGSSSIKGLKVMAYMLRVVFYIACSRLQRKSPA